MNLKQIINKSAYGTIGYVGVENDLVKIDKYFAYNREVIDQYAHIIIATNFDSEEHIDIHNMMCKHHFPNCILLNSTNNRGHNFGTADLDNTIFNYCKENNIEWLCKSANDMVIHDELLNKEIGEADFYYLCGFGYAGFLPPYNYTIETVIQAIDNGEYFYPQTNFFFINVSKTDYINDKQYINDTYKVTSIPGYNGKVWEYIKDWSCEAFLKQCVERNNLSKYHLVSKDKYIKLLNAVKQNKLRDPSHKNIMINGICHFQFPKDKIIII